jgi:hypothetical protein
MIKILLTVAMFLLVSCASFDKTNILPGQRVPGPAVSFVVPGETPWFMLNYATGNRLKLGQINFGDSFSIRVALNRGPRSGMYRSASDHLAALKSHIVSKGQPTGYKLHSHKEYLATTYGALCVGYESLGEDWRGRNNAGPAMVEVIGLTCAHPEINNALVNVEITRRYEVDSPAVDLSVMAETVFSSLEYDEI